MNDRNYRTILLCLAFSLVLLVGFWIFSMACKIQFSSKSILVFATMYVAVLPIFTRIVEGHFDLFEPVVGASFMLILLFTIRPLAMLISGEIGLYRGIDISRNIEGAILSGFLGTLAFVIAYSISIPKTFRSRYIKERGRSITNFPHLRLFCTFAFLASLLLYYLYLNSSGSFTSVVKLLFHGRSWDLSDALRIKSEYLSASPILSSTVALLIIVSRKGRKLSNGKLILVVVTVCYPVLAFATIGQRRFIIPSVIIPIVSYYLTAQTRPSLKTLIIFTPIFLSAILIIPQMRTAGARNILFGNEDYGTVLEQALFNSTTIIFLGPDTEMLPALALELKNLKSPGDYFFGKATLGDLIIAPIPSALFPQKPVTARNKMLIKMFGCPCNADPGGLCPDFSIIGTFYQDFWYVGVIIGMLVLGAVSRSIWKKYERDPTNPNKILLASCWGVFLPIIIRAGFMPAFSWFLYFLIPSLVGIRIVTKRIMRHQLAEKP